MLKRVSLILLLFFTFKQMTFAQDGSCYAAPGGNYTSLAAAQNASRAYCDSLMPSSYPIVSTSYVAILQCSV